VLVAFRDLRLGTIAPALVSALRGRSVSDSRRVAVRTDLDQIVVRADSAIPYQVDGDDLGDTTELVIRHEPDALNVVFPVVLPAR
jgi:diacylglycerol kinase family enzyme